MADIGSFLDVIRGAVYGEEVRNSIINALSAMNTINDQVSSSTQAQVDTYLSRFEAYAHVSQLPETGDEQKIYAVAQTEWANADSDTPAQGDTDWDTYMDDWSYIDVATNADSYTNHDANAVKPVMARYFIKAELKDQSNNYYPVDEIEFGCQQMLVEYRTRSGRSSSETINVYQLTSIKTANSNLDGQYGPFNIKLSIKEYIFDADDRIWKHNKDIAIRFNQTISGSVINDDYVINIVQNWDNFNFTTMLSKLNPPTDMGEIGIVQILYGGSIDWMSLESLEELIDEYSNASYIGERERIHTGPDEYGYETWQHTAIDSNAVPMPEIYHTVNNNITRLITPGPSTPVTWQVAVATAAFARMYIWDSAVGTYIQMTGTPEAPTADGTYTLKCTVANGVPTYSWVLDS